MDNYTRNVSQYIGAEIKKRRKKLGVTGSLLAEHLQISQQQVSRYERGINQPSVMMMMRIFASLEMSDSEIKIFLIP
ncbi:MAG: hypothetical protein XXXJIFNMEKO3_02553 [Candidatus Erwinia impunctatus]|nr:hypothetical protein XXXJIFNMEKO_02553 [Culicoides impunctatus]